MNVENIRKWTAALRSGEYRQGHGQLKSDKGHCCLGVLCEVAGIPYVPADSYPPAPAMQWLGFDTTIQMVDSPVFDFTMLCAGWNDDAKLSFEEIAEYVEGHLLMYLPQEFS